MNEIGAALKRSADLDHPVPGRKRFQNLVSQDSAEYRAPPVPKRHQLGAWFSACSRLPISALSACTKLSVVVGSNRPERV
jgi:hypothetical protein